MPTPVLKMFSCAHGPCGGTPKCAIIYHAHAPSKHLVYGLIKTNISNNTYWTDTKRIDGSKKGKWDNGTCKFNISGKCCTTADQPWMSKGQASPLDNSVNTYHAPDYKHLTTLDCLTNFNQYSSLLQSAYMITYQMYSIHINCASFNWKQTSTGFGMFLS